MVSGEIQVGDRLRSLDQVKVVAIDGDSVKLKHADGTITWHHRILVQHAYERCGGACVSEPIGGSHDRG